MSSEREYVLGTHDEEIFRLRLQHRVWRPRALDAWRRAGFTIGQRLLDVGCGPGYGTLDLAEIVGSAGRVSAIDESKRFLETLENSRRRRGLGNIDAHQLDLDEAELPMTGLDGAWCRWVFAFLKHRRDVLARVCGALRRGGTIVLHEYFDYSTWRMAPRCEEIEEFVSAVMESWRAEGGEPDIALDLPRWLAELGFEIKTLNPIIDIVPASNFVWQWPKTFVQVGLKRLVNLNHMTSDRAWAVSQALAACESAPHTWMITPAVLEIIAVRK
jgi:SAM-dependent methyltransferase